MKFTAGQPVAHRQYPAIRVTVACPEPDKWGHIVVRGGNGTYLIRAEADFRAVHPLTPRSAQTNS